MRVVLALLVLAVAAPAAAGDNQVRVFFGGTFGGGTTFTEPDHAIGKPHPALGVSVVSLGNIFGLDADVAHMPGFFQNSDSANLVVSSSVTTLTGNVVVAAPRSKTEYGVRPYLVAGGGMMRVRINDYFRVFERSRILPAFDVGAGAIGFLTNRVGLSWELRRFQSLSGDEESGLTLSGTERLSFWRASMAFVYRY